MREDTEIWVDLEDFPNHQISTAGRIRNKHTGHILRPFSDRYGYLRLSIGNVDNVSRCLVGSRKGQKLHGYTIEYC